MNNSNQDIINIINEYVNYSIKIDIIELLTKKDIIKISTAIKSNDTIYKLVISKKKAFYNINKQTYFNILFDILKENNNINTLKIKKVMLNSNEINSLSEMLKINKSITHLNLNLDFSEIDNINDCIKLFDSIKSHNNLINIMIRIYSNHTINNDTLGELIIDSLQNQLNLQKIDLSTKYSTCYNPYYTFPRKSMNSFIQLLNKLQYLTYINIKHILPLCKYRIADDILKTLHNKNYLRYVNLSFNFLDNFKYLTELINTCPQLNYLNISKIQFLSNTDINNFMDAIYKSNINYFKFDSYVIEHTNEEYSFNSFNKFLDNNHLHNCIIQSCPQVNHNICYDKLYILLNKLETNPLINNLKICNNWDINDPTRSLPIDVEYFPDNCMNSLLNLIKNNNLEKLNIYAVLNDLNCIKLFNCLKNNNSLYILKIILDSKHFEETYSDDFINSFCDLLINNKSLNKICIKLRYTSYKKISIEQYNKINNAIQQNNNLISLKWLCLDMINDYL